MNISLPLEMEKKLREYTTATGLDLEHFVLKAIEEKMADVDLSRRASSVGQEEFRRKLQKIIDLHPELSTRADDSRESIYADHEI